MKSREGSIKRDVGAVRHAVIRNTANALTLVFLVVVIANAWNARIMEKNPSSPYYKISSISLILRQLFVEKTHSLSITIVSHKIIEHVG